MTARPPRPLRHNSDRPVVFAVVFFGVHRVPPRLTSTHFHTRFQHVSTSESLVAMMRSMADDPCLKPCLRACRDEDDEVEDDLYDFSEHGGDAAVSAAVATRYRLDQDILDDVWVTILNFIDVGLDWR